MVSLGGVRDALAKIEMNGRELCILSPILESSAINRTLSEQVGRTIRIVFKAEHLQPVGSFKIRGAMNFALSIDPSRRARGLVTHSSGNHGAAVAQVAEFLNVPCVVVVPRDTPDEKVGRIRSYGAEVIPCEHSIESRTTICSSIVLKRGMTEIPPFDHEWTIHGQGTLAMEIMAQVPNLDTIVVAVGGCGMIAGVITAAKGLNPTIRVYGAEPSAVDDTHASLKEGQRRGPTDPSAVSICDALRVSPPGKLGWEVVRSGCDGVILVPDSETIGAMKVLMNDLKQVVEPSGAVATAAVLSDDFIEILKMNPDMQQIVVVLCGGNIGIDAIRSYI